MILSKERRFNVRMGDYENYSFGATVSVSHFDLGMDDTELARMEEAEYQEFIERLFELCDKMLVRALRANIEEAANLTSDKRSFIIGVLTPTAPAKSHRAIKKRS